VITDIARESKLPGPSAESKRVCVSMCLYITFLTSKDLKKSRVKSAQLLEDWTPVKSLIRPSGPVLLGRPHLNDVYIQWKVREWENERESIGTEFYYIGMTDKKKKQNILACQLYFSMSDFSSPPHLIICFGPHWVFCFMRIRLPLSFYSISRIQEERKKWWLGRNLTKIIRITLVARGTFGMGWGWLWVRRTCYSSTSSLVAGSFFFAASDSFFLSLDIPSECSGIHGH